MTYRPLKRKHRITGMSLAHYIVKEELRTFKYTRTQLIAHEKVGMMQVVYGIRLSVSNSSIIPSLIYSSSISYHMQV